MQPIEMQNLTDDFGKARDYVEAVLKKGRAADPIIAETMLVFEALIHRVFEQRGDSDRVVTISERENFGLVSVKIGYEGEMFVPVSDTQSEYEPEERILLAYADKIDCLYRAGYNTIRITAKRGGLAVFLPNVIGVILALAVAIPIYRFARPLSLHYILNHIIFPVEEMFTNAILMVGAPVTFFSLLKNLTDTYIVSEGNSRAREMQRSAMISSLLAVFLAIITGFLMWEILGHPEVPFLKDMELKIEMTLPEFIRTLVPSDILTPFQTFSPFPLIIVAVINTYALCSAGIYFDRMKAVIDIGYGLFSRMLSIIIYSMPVLIFVAFVDMLLSRGYMVLWYLGEFFLVMLAGTVMLAVFYLVELKLKGVPVRAFLKDLRPLLYENIKINSVIDAVPFNIRYLVRVFRMDRKSLETVVPLLAQINLDGNCYFITLAALVFMLVSNTEFTFMNVFLIANLVFFLSLGAPNQPGSFLIGMLVILHYMDAYHLIPLAIFCEVFFGWLLNITNVIGDMISVSDLANRYEKK